MRRRRLLALPLCAGLAAPGRIGAQTPLVAVASFSILADLLRQIAGDRVAVRAIVGPEADAHTHEARPADLLAVRDAALLVRNGLGFDPWFDRLARAAGGNARLITASEGVTPLPTAGGHAPGGHTHQHGPSPQAGSGRRAPDPHAWGDLRLAIRYARTIGAGLAASDPAGAAAHEAGTGRYVQRLHALDAWVRESVAAVPDSRRIVVTAHDAFGYFGAAYGIRFLAAAGLSSASEPSAASFAALIRRIRAERVSAVFLEAGAAPATVRRLAAETGVVVRGRLYADTLSAADGPAPTFEAMVRHNVGLLVPAMLAQG